MTIALRSLGTFGYGSGATVTPGLPDGWAENDIFILACQCADGLTVTAPAGWTEITGSPQSVSPNARLTAFWRRAVSGDTAPVITNPGAYIITRIAAFSDCVPTGDPFYDTAGGTNAIASTSFNFPAVDVLASQMVVGLCADSGDTTTPEFNAFDFPDVVVGSSGVAGGNNNTGTGGGIGFGWGLSSQDQTAMVATGGTAGSVYSALLIFSLIPDPATANRQQVDYATLLTVADAGSQDQQIANYATLLMVVDNEPHNQSRVNYASLLMVVDTSPPPPTVSRRRQAGIVN